MSPDELQIAIAYASLPTVAFFIHYLVIDALSIGKLRRKHKIPFPRTTGNEEFERAFRAFMNQAEQAPVFLSALWMYSLFVDARTGCGLGFLWIIIRSLYTHTYRRTSDFRQLIKFTFPAYGVLLFMMGAVVLKSVSLLFLS